MSFRDFVNENGGISKRRPVAPPVIQEQKTMIDRPEGIRRQTPVRRPRPVPKAPEEDVITESDNMIETLQEKIVQVFYRFGLAGLNRVDDAIIECVNQMLHPEGTVAESTTQRPAARKQSTATAGSAKKPAAKRPMTVAEIAAAALRDLPPMNGDQAATVAKKAPTQSQVTMPRGAAAQNETYGAPEPTYEDPMAALAEEKLNPEEMAMLQQQLAEEGMSAESAVIPQKRDLSVLSIAAGALQK